LSSNGLQVLQGRAKYAGRVRLKTVVPGKSGKSELIEPAPPADFQG
jgi:hypothetical protein